MKHAIAVLGTLVIVGAAPAPARAAIVLGVGAHGLKLGDSGADVKRELGKPDRVQKYKGGQSWFFDDGYWITVSTKRVVRGIQTSDEGQRTAKGVGPGTRLKRLKAAYPAITCKKHFRDDWLCKLRQGPGTVPTRFVFFDHMVEYVDIGSVGEFG